MGSPSQRIISDPTTHVTSLTPKLDQSFNFGGGNIQMFVFDLNGISPDTVITVSGDLRVFKGTTDPATGEYKIRDMVPGEETDSPAPDDWGLPVGFAGVNATTGEWAWTATVEQLMAADTNGTGKLTFAYGFVQTSFYVNGNEQSDTNPVYPIAFSFENLCFAEGTLIATPTGNCPVEQLQIGDSVLTADGRTISVKWIGRQHHSKLLYHDDMRPISISAGAFGDGLPKRDLTVTADHGFMLDGMIVNAGALVNGSTITRVPLEDLPLERIFYHIETEDHEIILAEGTPTETFVDAISRRQFYNVQEYYDLYGPETPVREMTHLRIASQRVLPDAIKARIGLNDTGYHIDPDHAAASLFGAPVQT